MDGANTTLACPFRSLKPATLVKYTDLNKPLRSNWNINTRGSSVVFQSWSDPQKIYSIPEDFKNAEYFWIGDREVAQLGRERVKGDLLVNVNFIDLKNNQLIKGKKLELPTYLSADGSPVDPIIEFLVVKDKMVFYRHWRTVGMENSKEGYSILKSISTLNYMDLNSLSNYEAWDCKMGRFVFVQ